MWKPTLVAALALLAATTAGTGAVPANESVPASEATPNEPPLADAGLDQEVTKGATVLLDGTGSRDPDGSIERYDWSIRTPGNETITPDCADCARTSFTPSEVGRYRVTLTVTDGGGAESSDTLYVDVSPGSGPGISLSGPRQPTEGSSGTYTARFDAGTADLDYAVWTIDGVEIANRSLSPGQATDAATKHFPTAGSRSISATVYDADGQSSTASLSVAVQPRDESSQETSPRESPTGGTLLSERASPTVTGDAVVTGSEPLRGQYDVELDAVPDEVASVEWQTAAGRVGTGRSLTRAWTPGDHQLYAVVTYADGSENVATFANGTTEVVADPRPNVSVQSLDRLGSISGTAAASDEYENLDRLRVEIDGEIVAESRSTLRGRHRLEDDHRRMVHFSETDFTSDEPYSVTVVAVDERGQTTEVTREVTPVEKPEIVRSEFVNDPVDSYHERLDPERYAAHHVLEIDLNGVDPEKLDVEMRARDNLAEQTDKGRFSRHQSRDDGVLRIDSFWAGQTPAEYEVSAKVNVTSKPAWSSKESTKFRVTPSNPELRLNVVNDGTADYITRDHGILVNAEQSFDPDGTDLKYIWKYGANPTKPDNTTAKFRTYERAASIVEDGYELQTKREFDFLDYFVPEIADQDVLTEGPYDSDETVRVRVQTEPYHFSKQTYYDDFELGVSVSNPSANVVRWEQVKTPDSEHSEPTEEAYRYVGVIELPASELALTGQKPSVSVYNEQNTRKVSDVTLPEVGVLLEENEYWTDVSVRNLTYLIEKPQVSEVTAETKQVRDEYRERGYRVQQTNETRKYELQERVKVQEAQYETEERTFEEKRVRDVFLGSSEGWYQSGTSKHEETRTRQYSEWHSASNSRFQQEWSDGSLWNGERTGSTRTVILKPAEYRTERQYRYDYDVEKTGMRTVQRTRTVPVTKTKTRSVTRCTAYGCYERTITYTYETTKTYTYTTVETYTYTVTESKTYWASSRYDRSHTSTGKTRRVKVKDAVYEQQREVQYRDQYTETVTRYRVARDKQVQKPVYEWRSRSTTGDYLLAKKQLSNRDGWRIRKRTATVWTLTKEEGSRRFWASTYENEDFVVKTTATVTGTRTVRFYNSKTESSTEDSERISKKFSFTESKSSKNIVEIISGEDESVDWCSVKRACSEK